VTREDVELSAEDGVLTIAGKRSEAGPEGRLLARGLPRGDFQLRLRLGDHIDTDAIEASLAEGVLRVTLPKVAEAQPRKIEVKAS
jgi:HSP20 family protein